MITNELLPTRILRQLTARDLMVENPVSLNEDATMQEAMALFSKKRISAAPVINAAGHPVGVLSCSDVLMHEYTKLQWPCGITAAGNTRVEDSMTPAVYSVSPDTFVAKIIDEMLALNVHHLFVVDDDGVLVGVISTLDVLRHFRP